jgi:hypothetical protein
MFLFSDSTLHFALGSASDSLPLPQIGGSARRDRYGNARLVPSPDGTLGSFFELDLLKK